MGSLLNHGRPSGDYDSGPLLTVDFYRHWPRQYVDTTASAIMRR